MVVVFHDSIRVKVCREAPALSDKIEVIGQAVLCDASRYDLRGALGLHPGDFVFFQPAGIRRVKNVPLVIPPLAALQRRHPDLKYVLAGPVIEPDEAARVTELLRDLPWATYLGAVDHDQICASLSSVEVAINSSYSEGGMSNAVLEAMSKGVPVLASDIEGNRSVIADGEDGFLFGTAEEFLGKAERLLDDPALRAVMGRRARVKIATQFRLEGEIGKYLEVYRGLDHWEGVDPWTSRRWRSSVGSSNSRASRGRRRPSRSRSRPSAGTSRTWKTSWGCACWIGQAAP